MRAAVARVLFHFDLDCQESLPAYIGAAALRFVYPAIRGRHHSYRTAKKKSSFASLSSQRL